MLHHMTRLLAVMTALRDPEWGCPWDRRQTMQSLVPHTLEEAYEVADAVEHGGTDEIREELGDLLFQVVFYSEIAREAGWFDFEGVAASIADKLERRHPHVFPAADGRAAQEPDSDWERRKCEERRKKALYAGGAAPGALTGVADALPSLTRAVKLQKRAARVGFDWDDVEQVIDKVLEELDEVRKEIAAGDEARLRHEVGDLLLATSNLARHLDVDPEQALRLANRRFERRFAAMERMLEARGEVLEEAAAEQLEALWLLAKKEEGSS